MIPVSQKQLNTQQALIIPNVLQGFADYPYLITEHPPKRYIALLQTMIERNGINHSFADCYFHRLSQSEQAAILKQLPPQWHPLLQHWAGQHDLYLQFESADDPWLELLLEMSSRELLFSSFYFTKYPCTIWSNYGLKYALFFKDKTTRIFYSGILNR